MKQSSRTWRRIVLVAGFVSGYAWLRRWARQRRLQLLLDETSQPLLITDGREVIQQGCLHSRHCAISLRDDGVRIVRGLFRQKIEFIPGDCIRRVELTQTIGSVSLPVNMLHLILADKQELWLLLDKESNQWLDQLLIISRDAKTSKVTDL